MWPWVKIQIVPPVSIPIQPLKQVLKWVGEFTQSNQNGTPKMGSQNGFAHHSHVFVGGFPKNCNRLRSSASAAQAHTSHVQIFVWVNYNMAVGQKMVYPKWHPGKWKQGLKPVPWWFNFVPHTIFHRAEIRWLGDIHHHLGFLVV